MGVPDWLLKIVMSKRSRIVKYKGPQSSQKPLAGGGPQCNLLGLILFLVLINDVGFENQQNNTGDVATSKRNMREANRIHLKFVDDVTFAESIDLKEKLVQASEDRPQPDNFHSRTGHALRFHQSQIYQQLLETEKYAKDNEMQINYKKTKLIMFNPAKSLDFMPEFTLGGNEMELVEEMKLLGLIFRSDLKWSSNTESMVLKGFKRLWMLRRLKQYGAKDEELLDVYVKQIRSVLELLAVPVWQSSITLQERCYLAREMLP